MYKRALVLLLLFSVGAAFCQTPLIADKSSYSKARMDSLWYQLTKGRNLALGKFVSYIPTPKYRLTIKGKTDNLDLTDGKLPDRKDQKIWWCKDAVGWYWKTPKKIIIDLGQPKCVDRIVWRVVAGSAMRDFKGPAKVSLYGSLDAKNVFLINERYRWAEDNARSNNYRLPNLGSLEKGGDVYVYPISVKANNYKMRYVIIEFLQDSFWFASDELAVIEGTGKAKNINQLKSIPMQTSGVWLASPENTLPLLKGIMMPLWFRQTDLRENGKKNPVKYEFILPAGINMHVPGYYNKIQNGNKLIVEAKKGGNSQEIGPFFFTAADKIKFAVSVKYRAMNKGKTPQPLFELKLVPEKLPNFKPLTKLSLSIGWMVDNQRQLWPGFSNSYKKLGFNTVPAFPRTWSNKLAKADYKLETIEKYPNPAQLTPKGRQLEKLRRQGFKIIFMDSPLHVVNWQYKKQTQEFRCQLPTKIVTESWCPTYRGKYYANEMKRLKLGYLLMGGADYVMWDCELLGPGLRNGKVCNRCQNNFKNKGKSWYDFVKAKTIEMLQDFNRQIIETAKLKHWKKPEIGMYGIDRDKKRYAMLKFPVAGFNFQNPSLYVGNNTMQIHKKIRSCRKNSRSNNIIPWLTAGTMGQVTPKNVRISLWEALINGSCGATYFKFSDFNPAQYFELAKAVAAISPVEDIVFYGKPAYKKFAVDNKKIRLSACRWKNQALLLLVNKSANDQKTKWRFLGRQKMISGQIVIPASDAVLLTIKLK